MCWKNSVVSGHTDIKIFDLLHFPYIDTSHNIFFFSIGFFVFLAKTNVTNDFLHFRKKKLTHVDRGFLSSQINSKANITETPEVHSPKAVNVFHLTIISSAELKLILLISLNFRKLGVPDDFGSNPLGMARID